MYQFCVPQGAFGFSRSSMRVPAQDRLKAGLQLGVLCGTMTGSRTTLPLGCHWRQGAPSLLGRAASVFAVR